MSSRCIAIVPAGWILWPAVLALVAGAVPGAQFGGTMSKKVNTQYLRMSIAVIIAITDLRMWYQMLTGR